MANSQAMCTSFKTELFNGTHNFGTAPTRANGNADTFKAALYLTTASLGATTTSYGTATGEVSGINYNPGGVPTGSWATPAATGTTAFTTPTTNFVWDEVTINSPFDAVLIYNSSQGGKAVSVHTFAALTIVSGVFVLTVPTNDSTTALLRIA